MLPFYQNKKVLITGHTGFKGSWLTEILLAAGAQVIAVSSAPRIAKNLYSILKLKDRVKEYHIDIRDLEAIKQVVADEQPEIVFHLAAQAIVRTSYDNPIGTFTINTMGTANVLEAVRCTESVKSAVMITTDKVYDNKEWIYPYREIDPLGGHDPYSSSKAAADIIAQSYIKSFFTGVKGVGIARAGNVIGGGDWAPFRLIPDIAESILSKKEVLSLRSPHAIRPWQHVLEPLHGYLMLGQKLYEDDNFSGAWNFGPSERDTKTVEEVVKISIDVLHSGSYEIAADADKKHEATTLALDCTKSQRLLGWSQKMSIRQALELTLNWYDAYYNDKGDLLELTRQQINEFYTTPISDDVQQVYTEVPVSRNLT